MNNTLSDWWDERYRQDAYAYGITPNAFLAEQLPLLPTGHLLCPAEGEGRNAVFAARQGWTVSAFDISAEGRKKALTLAEQHGVKIDYQVGELQQLHYQPGQFDAIALIYAHFPGPIKSHVHRMLDQYLRPGGTVIFEAFSKRHLTYQAQNEKIGGPKDVDTLFSLDEIKSDFPDYKVLHLEETEVELSEGLYHNGVGSVIRFVGQKQ